MALNVSGSRSLYWQSGIDNTALNLGAKNALGIITNMAAAIKRVNPFAIIGFTATAVFAKAAKEAYEFSSQFGAAMKEVGTLSRMVREDFDGVSETVINLSRSIPEAAPGLVKALYQIVSAGYDTAEAFEILEQSAKLGVAGVSDTFTAADAITSILNAYGEAAGGAAKVSDHLFTTVRIGKTTLRELAPEIVTVTGLAAQAGMSFDDLMAAVAQGVKTLKTPEMMTGIRGILTAIISPTQEAQEVIKSLGLEFSLAQFQAKGYRDFLIDIMEQTEGNVAVLAKLFPNIRGLVGFLATATKGGEAYADVLRQIQHDTGETERHFATMVTKNSNQFQILNNNIMAQLKPLGDNIVKFVKHTVTSINSMFGGVIQDYQELISIVSEEKDVINDLADRFLELSKKKNKSFEDSRELVAIEEQLYNFIGDEAIKSLRGLTSELDLYSIAKTKIAQLDREALQLQKELAEIHKEEAEHKLELLRLEDSESEKRVKNARMEENLQRVNAMRRSRVFTQGMLGNEALSISAIKAAFHNIREERAEVLGITDSLDKLYNTQVDVNEANQIYNKVVNTILEKDAPYQRYMLNRKLEAKERSIEERKLSLEITKQEQAIVRLQNALSGIKSVSPSPEVEGPSKVAAPKFDAAAFIDDLNVVKQAYADYANVIVSRGQEAANNIFPDLAKYGGDFGDFLTKQLSQHKSNSAARKILESEFAGWYIQTNKKSLELVTDAAAASEEKIAAIKKKYEDARGVTSNESTRAQLAKMEKQEIDKVEFEKALDEKSFKWKAEWSKQELDAEIDRLELLRTNYEANSEELYQIDQLLLQRRGQIRQKEEAEERAVFESVQLAAKQYEKKSLDVYINFLKEKLKKVKEGSDLQIELQAKLDAAMDKSYNAQLDKIDSIAGALQGMSRLAARFDENLGSALASMSDMIAAYGAVQAASTGVGSIGGGVMGGVAIIGSVISLMDTLFNDEGPSKWDKLIEKMDRLVQQTNRQIELVRKLNGEESVSGILGIVEKANTDLNTFVNEMNSLELFSKHGRSLILEGLLGDKYTQDQLMELFGNEIPGLIFTEQQEIFDALKEKIQDAQDLVDEYRDEYRLILTGTTTESIADSIADGFSEGLDSAQSFAKSFETLMRNSLIDAFKRTIVTQMLNDWYEEFAFLAEGGLTSSEMKTLQEGLESIYKGAEDRWKEFEEVAEATGFSLTNPGSKTDGMAGAIQGITEQTAGLLEGQFNAIRMTTETMLNSVRSSNEIHKIDTEYIKGIHAGVSYMPAMVGRLDRLIMLTASVVDNTRNSTNYLRAINSKTPESSVNGIITSGVFTGRPIGV